MRAEVGHSRLLLNVCFTSTQSLRNADADKLFHTRLRLINHNSWYTMLFVITFIYVIYNEKSYSLSGEARRKVKDLKHREGRNYTVMRLISK